MASTEDTGNAYRNLVGSRKGRGPLGVGGYYLKIHGRIIKYPECIFYNNTT